MTQLPVAWLRQLFHKPLFWVGVETVLTLLHCFSKPGSAQHAKAMAASSCVQCCCLLVYVYLRHNLRFHLLQANTQPLGCDQHITRQGGGGGGHRQTPIPSSIESLVSPLLLSLVSSAEEIKPSISSSKSSMTRSARSASEYSSA